MRKLALFFWIPFVGQWITFYCTRVGDDYPGHFICTDKDETSMDELTLSNLRGQPVPEDWARVKLSLRPYRPIRGKSIWPFWGYKLENYSARYNDGSLIAAKP